MTVRVKLFAAARELAGASEVVVEVGDGATLVDVERAVLAAIPNLAGILPHSRWAVDEEFATADSLVNTQAEIALIPPVSGG